jgi:hypothetical protein
VMPHKGKSMIGMQTAKACGKKVGGNGAQ